MKSVVLLVVVEVNNPVISQYLVY